MVTLQPDDDLDGPAYMRMLICPYLEQLCKAGYEFAFKLLRGKSDKYDQFYRLCKPGKNLKEIFKTSKFVYETLKGEENLAVWDNYRKMFKTGKISKDLFEEVYEQNFDGTELTLINEILNKTYLGKKVFTWTTLIRYLVRLDQYEAIPRQEALLLIRDYLLCCVKLNMKPRIDGDSLKREHDIAARMLRLHKDEIQAKKMEGACEYLKEDNYENDTFVIRGVTSYDDLVDEAKQQHNCVASYSDLIINRKSRIYFLRRKACPEKSYVTVELSPDKKAIRQKYLAYNKPVRSRAVTEFLEEWLRIISERTAVQAIA